LFLSIPETTVIVTAPVTVVIFSKLGQSNYVERFEIQLCFAGKVNRMLLVISNGSYYVQGR
jgi:hypothetical protein